MSDYRFAEGTTVTVDQSKRELRQLVERFGGTWLRSVEDEEHRALVTEFNHGGLRIRLILAFPDPDERRFRERVNNRRAKGSVTPYEQERRRLLRSLVHVTKARLVAIADGIGTTEELFMNDIVSGDGYRVGDVVRRVILPYIQEQGKMPQAVVGALPTPAELQFKMLPSGGESR